jgi:hypothetical protein
MFVIAIVARQCHFRPMSNLNSSSSLLPGRADVDDHQQAGMIASRNRLKGHFRRFRCHNSAKPSDFANKRKNA